MPPQNLNPQYSQWLQDFFTSQDEMPSLYQGMPGEYDTTSEDFISSWEGDLQCPEGYVMVGGGNWGFQNPRAGQCVYAGDVNEETLSSIANYFYPRETFHRPPEGIMSSYPEFREQYAILDYTLGGEKIRARTESERSKLSDLLESVQTTGPEGLRVGGVSRELENQRVMVNEGLADLEAKKAFGLKNQEIELAQDVYDFRTAHEQQASEEYLRWLNEYAAPEHEIDIQISECYDGCSSALAECNNTASHEDSQEVRLDMLVECSHAMSDCESGCPTDPYDV